MALGSTQPLVKLSTRNIPGGKGCRCVGLRTSPRLRAECHEIWSPKHPGPLWATPGLLWESFTFTSTRYCFRILMRLEKSQRIFEIQSNVTIQENASIGNRVVLCGQTDGQK
jgi:hypothetical protein